MIVDQFTFLFMILEFFDHKIIYQQKAYLLENALLKKIRLKKDDQSGLRLFLLLKINSAKQQFFRKNNYMASPHNFLNEMGSVSYPYNLMPLSYHQNALFNPLNSFQFSPFPNQIGFTYMFPQQSVFNQYPMYNMAPMMATAPLENTHKNIWSRDHQKIEKKEQTIKNEQVKHNLEIIQISQDNFAAAQQKISSDKNSSNIIKTTEKEQVINTTIIAQKQNKQILPLKPQEQKIKKVKQQIQSKPQNSRLIVNKKKEIKKKEIQKKEKVQPKNRIILSKRINQKLQNKQQPYKLSKKDKQLFQISYLRDSHKEIMTGPQFQANIPPFLLNNRDIITWKNKIKQNLLLRLYKEDDSSQ